MSDGIRVQFAAFLAAGGLATATHWALMASLIAVTVQPVTATAAGSVAGAVANYGLQRRLAFRNARGHGRTLWRYLGSCVFAWFANFALFTLLNHGMNLPVIAAQATTTALVAVLNFVIYRSSIFHEPTI